MQRKVMKVVTAIFLLLLLAACGAAPEAPDDLAFSTTPVVGGAPEFLEEAPEGYPVGGTSDTGNEGYPAPAGTVEGQSVDGRSQTAVAAYELALFVALDEFSPDAYLHTIAPSHIMLSNLGNPPVLPGWFYIFKRPESRRELIVQVVDNLVTGTTLTESVSDIQPAPLPIDMSQVVLDSDDVFARFDEVGGRQEGVPYDLELIYLTGSEAPIWSVVDPFSQQWIASFNAVTGEEAPNPYGQ
ncbi:hypothetical protein [Candidatus Leptofilum sp.]|uniref:hypothetical protein n=1 Tax=Candidatus Leptofilum sp. TaxID=3241576 RepID=UPI003B59E5E3